jgi:hypothetical protein
MTYNSLVWESIENLPIPNEVKSIVGDFKWEEYLWQSMGLPVNGGKYSVVGGKRLYLEEVPDGKTQVREDDFTGEIIFGTYIVNGDKEQNNYLLSFKAVFLKGSVIEVGLESCLPQDAKEYDEMHAKISEQLKARAAQEASWWYRWLYRPYRFILRLISTILVWILMFLRLVIIKATFFLTPI